MTTTDVLLTYDIIQENYDVLYSHKHTIISQNAPTNSPIYCPTHGPTPISLFTKPPISVQTPIYSSYSPFINPPEKNILLLFHKLYTSYSTPTHNINTTINF